MIHIWAVNAYGWALIIGPTDWLSFEKGFFQAYDCLPCDRHQSYLLPPSLEDWLPENDLVYFVLDTVNELDISAITEKYEQRPECPSRSSEELLERPQVSS